MPSGPACNSIWPKDPDGADRAATRYAQASMRSFVSCIQVIPGGICRAIFLRGRRSDTISGNFLVKECGSVCYEPFTKRQRCRLVKGPSSPWSDHGCTVGRDRGRSTHISGFDARHPGQQARRAHLLVDTLGMTYGEALPVGEFVNIPLFCVYGRRRRRYGSHDRTTGRQNQ
jgi:hypothetical protein